MKNKVVIWSIIALSIMLIPVVALAVSSPDMTVDAMGYTGTYDGLAHDGRLG